MHNHSAWTDISAALLTEPDDYDGELVIEEAFGCRRVKLAAGDLVCTRGPASTASSR